MWAIIEKFRILLISMKSFKLIKNRTVKDNERWLESKVEKGANQEYGKCLLVKIEKNI